MEAQDRPYERLLRQVIPLARAQLFERTNGVLPRSVVAFEAGELLCDVERLRKEPLDFSRPGDQHLVLRAQFVHAENCDDVLQVLVPLQDLLIFG